MSDKAFDVVVVGAGPGGSATAAFLAERGLQVALVDRAAFPRPKPCAEYLSPEAGRILERLGVLTTVQMQAQQLAGMTVVSPAGRRFTGRFSGATPYRGFSDHGLALPRAILDAELVRIAASKGAHVMQRTRLEQLGAANGRRTVEVRDDAGRYTLTARLVVGADGLNSRVAEQLGLSRRGRRRRVAFVAHASGVHGMGDLGEMHVGRGAYVGLASVGADLTNVAVVLDASRPIPGSSARERFDAGLARFPEIAERLHGAEVVGPILAAGPFARTTSRATADRVVLVGDAADFYDPFTGEGVFAALRGAELVVEHIAGLLEHDTLSSGTLAVYDRARHRQFRGKWLNERAIAFAIDRPALFDRIADRLGRRAGMADLLVGVTGDFVPPRAVLRPSFALKLVL
jgi:geranylgeranyl reductase family protein